MKRWRQLRVGKEWTMYSDHLTATRPDLTLIKYTI